MKDKKVNKDPIQRDLDLLWFSVFVPVSFAQTHIEERAKESE